MGEALMRLPPADHIPQLQLGCNGIVASGA